MAPIWTADKVQRLLELLREHHTELFAKTSTHYQRKLNNATFDVMAKELQISPQALKHKYFNLTSAYNTEVKKIDAAKRQGFFYRPTLQWFNEFRDIIEKVKQTTGPIVQEELKRISSQEGSISEEELDLEEEEGDPAQDTSDADAIVVTIKQEYIDGPLKGSRDVDFDEDPVEFVQEISVPTLQTRPPAKKAVKRRRERKQDLELYVPTSADPRVDEFQMFANHVAEQLRNMNPNSARKMQSEIHIIFDEEGFPFDSTVLEDMT